MLPVKPNSVVLKFCGIVDRPSRTINVLSISIVKQVFAISAASIIIVESKMFQLKATQECTEYSKQILFLLGTI